MIIIEKIKGGYLISETKTRWRYWAYPDDHEIRNNGERHHETHKQVAPRITLPMDWTIGDVVDQIVHLTTNNMENNNAKNN